ncbi:hypothetical protein [Massilia sp. IC2-476]|uniref:hypothetical protein n=1 Tax=Massilia sp. IC2-476 TaxID=2887199 RepID=UPI001D109872|nr:hypothetical protein [Massilia sp. IC2-476]MCC2974747.1 hypothetical protein [Massilia sp. IC2-476]
MTTGFRMGSSRWCLLVSVGVHAALAAWLYHVGNVELVRRQDTEVAESVRATAQARMARRVDDLRKIKELLEQSANRAPEPVPAQEPAAAAAAPAETATQADRMLKQAREMSRAIDELDRELKAEELARLTDKTKEEARAELDAAAPADPPADSSGKGDPAAELAALEEKARAVLASRAEQLAREYQGIQVERGDGIGSGSGKGSASGQGGTLALSSSLNKRTLEEIARFMREGRAPEADWTSPLYRNAGRDIFAGGKGQVPAIDAARMVKGRGRILGADGQYANRIYLNSWYIIGPFQGRHSSGLFNNPKYPPEDAVLLDAVYHGKNRRVVKWEYVNEARYPLVPPAAEENSVYYGYTEVFMDQERDMLVWIGADDNASVKVNDRLVWKGGIAAKRWFYQSVYSSRNTYERDYNRTEGQRLVRFRKGRNTVFFKLSNGPTRMFFSMVLTPVK